MGLGPFHRTLVLHVVPGSRWEVLSPQGGTEGRASAERIETACAWDKDDSESLLLSVPGHAGIVGVSRDTRGGDEDRKRQAGPIPEGTGKGGGWR